MIQAFRVPVLWLAIVLFLGTGPFGITQTGPWLIPLLKTLTPWATARELHGFHIVLRKLWHLTQYAILARTWMGGVLVWRRLPLRAAAWAALLVCVACAFVDELHQSMLLTRTGSVGDAILDCLGALMMLMMLRARYETRPAPTVARAAPETGG